MKKSTSSWKPFAEWKKGRQQAGQWEERGTPSARPRSRTGKARKTLPSAKRASPAAAPVRAFKCPHCGRKAVK